MPAGSGTTLPCRMRRMLAPASRAVSTSSASWSRPGCGARSASPPTSSRRTPSSRRVSVSASRAVAAIASNRPRASAESLGDVSRAVSLWTAITDRWCATMSCSSRAIRARSSIAVCSRTLSAIASCVASSSATTSVRLRVDSAMSTAATTSRSGPTLAGPASPPSGGAIAWMRNGSEQRDGEEEAAPDDEVPDRVEQDAERGQRDRRFGAREQEHGHEASSPLPRGTGTDAPRRTAGRRGR